MKHLLVAVCLLAASLSAVPASALPVREVQVLVTQGAGHADVHVVAHLSPDGDVHVNVTAQHGDVKDLPVRITKGATTVVSAEYAVDRGIFWFFNIDKYTLDVAIPSGQRVVIRDDIGGVDADGHWASLTVNTGNGGVHVTGTPVADIRTGNGGVTVQDATQLSVHTGNGGVNATIGGGIPSVDIHTGNGGVKLHLPAGTTTRVDAKTGNGGIDNPLDNGKGPGSIVVRTGNGGIGVDVAH